VGEIKGDAEKKEDELSEAREDLLAYLQSANSQLREIRQGGRQDSQERIHPYQIT
jgi:hypothetical protein